MFHVIKFYPTTWSESLKQLETFNVLNEKRWSFVTYAMPVHKRNDNVTTTLCIKIMLNTF